MSEDDARRENQRQRGYLSSYYGPKFDSPFEQRRLRILNSLMLETARAGAQLKVEDQSARSIRVVVNDMTLFLKIDHKKRLEDRSGYYHQTEDPTPDIPIHLVLSRSWNFAPDDLRWSDTDDRKIEALVATIVVEFFVQAEAKYREFRAWEHANRIEWKARRIEEIRFADERAEREHREEQERLRQERVSHLLTLSDDYRKAEAIRALIARVEEKRGGETQFAEWKKWSENVANEIDPIDDIDFNL